MHKIKVLTIGKCKEIWLADALSEYEKRLKGKVSFEWVIAKNDTQLLEHVNEEPFVIALDPKGELLTSEEWSKKFIRFGLKIAFVIGGAEGLPPAIFQRPHYKWSLSPLTFTHQMTRLILVEQVYRALEIDRGSQYHK
jgi:23S rRNA (pseudouridine1915-N3)-methyltransferase